MSNTDTFGFAKALQKSLTLYQKDINNAVNSVGLKSIKKLVNLTKSAAPVNKRTLGGISKRKAGHYKRSIAYTERFGKHGTKTYIWYVKGTDSRLTHLLANGHATKNGGRTTANPFLKDAADKVLTEYEHNIQEVLKGDY